MLKAPTQPLYTGEDLRKLEENYNKAQQQWVDDMINACHVSNYDN